MTVDRHDVGTKFSKLFVEQFVDRPIDSVPKAVTSEHPSLLRDLIRYFAARGVEEDAMVAFATEISSRAAHALLDFVLWGGGDIEDTGIQYRLVARGFNDESFEDIHDIIYNAQGELLEDDGWIVQYSKYAEYYTADSWPWKV